METQSQINKFIEKGACHQPCVPRQKKARCRKETPLLSDELIPCLASRFLSMQAINPI